MYKIVRSVQSCTSCECDSQSNRSVSGQIGVSELQICCQLGPARIYSTLFDLFCLARVYSWRAQLSAALAIALARAALAMAIALQLLPKANSLQS